MWPSIRRRAAPGFPLLRAVNRRNSNRISKTFIWVLSPEADRYCPHAFSRGAAQELKECGPPWSAVASAGLWRFPDFWGYLDMARDVEAPAQDRFEVAPDSDSDPGQD